MSPPEPPTDEGHGPHWEVWLLLLAEFAAYAAIIGLQHDGFHVWLRQRRAGASSWWRKMRAPSIAREAAPEVWWEAWCHAAGIDP